MTQCYLTDSESDGAGVCLSARSSTNSHIRTDGGVSDFQIPPSLGSARVSNDKRESSAEKREIPKFGRADFTQCPFPKIEMGRVNRNRSGNLISRSSSSNNSGDDGICKRDIKEKCKDNYCCHRPNYQTHRRQQRRRKELMSRESFFVDAHHELLLRYGPSYRDFVIPYPPIPKAPVNHRKERARKQS